MKKLIFLFLAFISLTGFAQPPFVVHMPFHGEPLFCHETACLRKASLAKKIKKQRHKRQVQARKASRNNKATETVVKNPVVKEPIEDRRRILK